jgi:hypothetical protein
MFVLKIIENFILHNIQIMNQFSWVFLKKVLSLSSVKKCLNYYTLQ